MKNKTFLICVKKRSNKKVFYLCFYQLLKQITNQIRAATTITKKQANHKSVFKHGVKREFEMPQNLLTYS